MSSKAKGYLPTLVFPSEMATCAHEGARATKALCRRCYRKEREREAIVRSAVKMLYDEDPDLVERYADAITTRQAQLDGLIPA